MNNEIIIAVIGLAGVIFASQGFWSWLIAKNKSKSNESKLLMGIGYSKIIDLCEKHIANGYITTRELHELEHYLYEPYRDMGGNGTVEVLMENVRDLPVKTVKGEKA